jgi:hypothetical protein
MGYRDNIKVLLMRGKAYKNKGRGIGGLNGKFNLPAIEAPRGTGTITNRGIVDREIMEKMGNFNIVGKGSKKGSNFKPLKFNF